VGANRRRKILRHLQNLVFVVVPIALYAIGGFCNKKKRIPMDLTQTAAALAADCLKRCANGGGLVDYDAAARWFIEEVHLVELTDWEWARLFEAFFLYLSKSGWIRNHEL
jgi:hypothetical protein